MNYEIEIVPLVFLILTEKYSLKRLYHVPALFYQRKADEILKETAIKIYKILKCQMLCKLIWFLTFTGENLFNEVNTIPAFTQNTAESQYAKEAGFSFLQNH